MTTVASILKSKAATSVHSISAAGSVFDAIRLMTEANVGALVVFEHEQVVGIVSERDCARKLVLQDRAARQTSVRQIMSTPVLVVGPERTCEECMALMTENRLRHLPVVDGVGSLIGMVSIGDLVKSVVADQRFVIEQLEHYISGEAR
jgi:CBS domain-containing protein